MAQNEVLFWSNVFFQTSAEMLESLLMRSLEIYYDYGGRDDRPQIISVQDWAMGSGLDEALGQQSLGQQSLGHHCGLAKNDEAYVIGLTKT